MVLCLWLYNAKLCNGAVMNVFHCGRFEVPETDLSYLHFCTFILVNASSVILSEWVLIFPLLIESDKALKCWKYYFDKTVNQNSLVTVCALKGIWKTVDIFFVPTGESTLNFFVSWKTFFIPNGEKSASWRTFSIPMRKLFECRKTVSTTQCWQSHWCSWIVHRSLDGHMLQTTSLVRWNISAKHE